MMKNIYFCESVALLFDIYLMKLDLNTVKQFVNCIKKFRNINENC